MIVEAVNDLDNILVAPNAIVNEFEIEFSFATLFSSVKLVKSLAVAFWLSVQ
ncbi:hypothetical protein [Mycoplasmopsis canis]|uniref:hypothetical protein n=1 Tax=Mycoplasmopsis canis TaxID=29555 RepID=UPI001F3C2635|nr:hypothetical protein [Mycoplasmopsis canis]